MGKHGKSKTNQGWKVERSKRCELEERRDSQTLPLLAITEATSVALEDDYCDDNANNDAFSKGQPEDLIIRQPCFLLNHRDQAFMLVSEFLHPS